MEQEYLREPFINTILKNILKIILFIVLLVLFFVLGLFIGYSILGTGNFWEVLNKDTWQHIVDFIYK